LGFEAGGDRADRGSNTAAFNGIGGMRRMQSPRVREPLMFDLAQLSNYVRFYCHSDHRSRSVRRSGA